MLLTDEERQLAIGILAASREHLERLLSGLNEPNWRVRPPENGWSIAEIAEHLVEVEKRTLIEIEKALTEPPAPEEQAAKVRG